MYIDMIRLFPQTAQVKNGHLVVGGCDTVALAAEFGTPLYIYDETTLRSKCCEYRHEFTLRYADCSIAYACKSFLNPALAQVLKEEKLGLDVVSGGELHIASTIDFPMGTVYFNGNNKSIEELEMAIDLNVGYVVVDNSCELDLLGRIAQEKGAKVKVLLRLLPGVDPHTHDHLSTGSIDSKFGFTMAQADRAVAEAMRLPSIYLAGFHFHIGSQILDTTPYVKAIDAVFGFIQQALQQHNLTPDELSAGGGLGIAYTRDSSSPSIADFAEAITGAVLEKCRALHIKPPHLIIEPGRSIVGQAGVALYTVGAIKHIEGVRDYIAVDGGMSDNIRPALYGAKYEAVVANKMNQKETETVTIAGKLCESGDVLVRDIALPHIKTGDLIAVPCCGAYCLSMASNYNASPRPAIVMVRDGNARLIRRRENYEDLIRCDIF